MTAVPADDGSHLAAYGTVPAASRPVA